MEISSFTVGASLEAAFNAAFASVQEIHTLLSAHDSASDLSRLNYSAGAELELHPLSIAVLRLARGMSIASQNLFNSTVGGKLLKAGILPRHGDAQPLESGDASDIELHGRRARLRRPIHLTLDGIAKGFAVDSAVAVLKKFRIKSGCINAGGDLRAFGEMEIPVHRREPDGTLHPLLLLKNSALASSSVAEAWNERFPGWIVGSGTNLAAKGCWSVSASHAWRADALTKVACLASRAEREKLVEKLGGILVSSSEGSGT